MNTTTTIKTTRYATQDRVVRVLAGLCMLAGLVAVVDLSRSYW